MRSDDWPLSQAFQNFPYFGWCYRLYILYQPKYGLNLVDALENATVYLYMCLAVYHIVGFSKGKIFTNQ